MKGSISRIQKELKEVFKSFPSGVLGVTCADGDLHEIHFVLSGPDDTSMAGGQYWGKLVLPASYPAAPPSIFFFTPSGRFETGVKICTSFSDFHPESWSVSWRLSTLLIAIRSFMVEEAPTAGSIRSFSFTRRELAAKSWGFNAGQIMFRKMFPELCDAAKGEKMLQSYRSDLQRQQLGILVGLMVFMICVVVGRLVQWI